MTFVDFILTGLKKVFKVYNSKYTNLNKTQKTYIH